MEPLTNNNLDPLSNLDLFSVPDEIKSYWDHEFSAHIDGPGAPYVIQHTSVKDGNLLLTVTRLKDDGTYITFQVVVYLGDNPTVKVVASSPGDTDGHFDGSMSVLRSLSGRLVKTIEAGITGAVSAPVETDGASVEQREAVLTTLGLAYDIGNSNDQPFDTVLQQCNITVKRGTLDGHPTLEVVSSEGAFGLKPFNYQFAKGMGDWEPILDWLYAKLK